MATFDRLKVFLLALLALASFRLSSCQLDDLLYIVLMQAYQAYPNLSMQRSHASIAGMVCLLSRQARQAVGVIETRLRTHSATNDMVVLALLSVQPLPLCLSGTGPEQTLCGRSSDCPL